MMSGNGANLIFFNNKKKKDWTSRTLANPPPPPLPSPLFVRQHLIFVLSPFQSERYMFITSYSKDETKFIIMIY